ncbi:MAG: Fur family transcriptional regulator [Planctomycetota bacterium]
MNPVELLKQHNLYETPTRRHVIGTLLSSPMPMDAKQIYAKLSEPPNLATIHRTLKTLEKHGLVTGFSDGSSRKYLLNTEAFHGHIVLCLNCGKSHPIESSSTSCSVERDSEKAFAELGFRTLCHSVVLYGYCESCRFNDPQHICGHCSEAPK